MREYYKNQQKTAETLKDGWLYTAISAVWMRRVFLDYRP